jgi:hypothetical protein
MLSSCFPRCIFYECTDCVRLGRTKVVAQLRARKKLATTDLVASMGLLFKGKPAAELNFLMKRILTSPEIVWSPDAPETCWCAIYYAVELLKMTEDLVELKPWLVQHDIDPSMETAVIENIKGARTLCIVRQESKWHAKRATALNAYNEASLETAISRKQIAGTSLREAASEYKAAHSHLFTSDAFFVKNGRVWHRWYAPVPPPELFGALSPENPERTL